LRKIVSIMHNSKTAEALEKRIINLIVISYFHYESGKEEGFGLADCKSAINTISLGKLDQEAIATIESYLRRALKVT